MTMSICIAESYPLLREALRSRLNLDERFHVESACGAESDLVDAVRRHQPDVVLVDLDLDDGAGIDCVTRIRREAPSCRVIALAGSDRVGGAHLALSAGASGCLCKAQRFEQVADAIVDVCAGGTVVSPRMATELLMGASTNGAMCAKYLPTESDVKILRMVADGATDQTIARELFVSTRTVQNHLARIRSSIGVRRRAELVCWAVEQAFV